MQHIKFTLSPEERYYIAPIIQRAVAMDPEIDPTELNMDLTATHANGCPLDFKKLLSFPPFDFNHDIYGIQRHIDRNTGKLKDFFLPRCSKPSKR